MQLIAIKQFRYPYNGPIHKKGEIFDANDAHAKTLIATGMAQQQSKRKYLRRDMTAEDSKE